MVYRRERRDISEPFGPPKLKPSWSAFAGGFKNLVSAHEQHSDRGRQHQRQNHPERNGILSPRVHAAGFHRFSNRMFHREVVLLLTNTAPNPGTMRFANGRREWVTPARLFDQP
jgi:hypothetical protein